MKNINFGVDDKVIEAKKELGDKVTHKTVYLAGLAVLMDKKVKESSNENS